MSSSRATAMQADGVRPAAPLPAAVVSLPKPDRAPHGAAEVVSVRAVLDRGERSARILGRVCGAARQGPVCLHPVDLPADGPGLSAWSQFCELLRAAALRRQVPLGEIATCIHSHHLPLRDFHGLTDAAFGEGDRFVFLDNLQMQCHRNERVAAVTADNWTYFWRDRHEAGRVMPVYGGHVRSACALLADEVAMTVAPGPGLLSPGHSAWLPVRTDLSALADERGEIDEDLLRSTVDAALTAAEQRFDGYRWPGRRRRADAYLNRRVALLVTGIGDLVERSGADPAGLPCLQAMQRLVRCIRQQLDQPAEAEKNLRAVVDGADQPEIRQLAVNRLADVLYLQGKTEEAVTLWSEIAEDPAPTFPLNTVLKKLAEARQASGDLAKALELYRRLASEFPSDPDARLTDARIALLAGQVESNETPDAEESEEESSSE